MCDAAISAHGEVSFVQLRGGVREWRVIGSGNGMRRWEGEKPHKKKIEETKNGTEGNRCKCLSFGHVTGHRTEKWGLGKSAYVTAWKTFGNQRLLCR